MGRPKVVNEGPPGAESGPYDPRSFRVGDAARALRLSRRLTQQALAPRLGLSSVYISQIENGASFPSYHVLGLYRREFGVDPFALAWVDGVQADDSRPIWIRRAAEVLAGFYLGPKGGGGG